MKCILFILFYNQHMERQNKAENHQSRKKRQEQDQQNKKNNRIISNPKMGQHKSYQRIFITLCLQKGQFMILC